MGEAVEIAHAIDGLSKSCYGADAGDINGDDCDRSCWYEEILNDDLKWSFALNRFHKLYPRYLFIYYVHLLSSVPT